jgi:hypothetical protein
MNQTNYLNLQDILVNELFGDVLLFFFIGLMIIWVICLKSKTGIQVPIVLSFVWVGLFMTSYFTTFKILWVLVLFIAAFTFYYNISNLLK